MFIGAALFCIAIHEISSMALSRFHYLTLQVTFENNAVRSGQVDGRPLPFHTALYVAVVVSHSLFLCSVAWYACEFFFVLLYSTWSMTM
jgi:hypothetical protein